MPRLFIALRPPGTVRDTLLDAMGGIEGARWQDDEQLHCTLAFLGQVDGTQVEPLIAALEQVESPAFAIEVAGVGHFERKGLPSALWAGVPLTEPLARLQRRVVSACREAGIVPEKRNYRPHVTLARLPRSAGPVGDWLALHGRLRAGPWEVIGFTVFESTLSPAGAVYEPLVEYEL
ncbi:RNA 2',3'-cyclic phosphodiesterase [Altererythrobacter soli]|uniref:RNA 2',3'-cyclic phosphodiesterase n=1 Tax=Croceibacterium soli TaxID=1739690 RepID=A0A6I4UTC9_9SPHN|nr:RNA 2',3'-cyclic phosphodiesterase [Croceibacterium soli]MXP41024.1 RNA 2',3'-cyclic phosphodiesterase [Croceibacterium soli]